MSEQHPSSAGDTERAGRPASPMTLRPGENMTTASGEPPEPPTTNAALGLLAFALAGLAVALIVLTEAWLERQWWIAPVSGACMVVAGIGFARMVQRAELPWLERRSGGGDPGALARGAAPPDGLRRTVRARPVRSVLVILGLIAGGVTVAIIHGIGDDQPAREYWIALTLWCGSIVVYTAGFLIPDRIGPVRGWLRRHRAALLDTGLLFAAALLLRLWALPDIPHVITGDEGVFGRAAEWMRQGEGGHQFGTYWANGTLYLVPHAALLALGVPEGWAIRLPTAVGGALAVPVTVLIGRQLFSRKVGWVAGGLLAASHLHIHLSRIGLGHGLDALWSAVAIWGIATGMLQHRVGRAVVGGVALGLAQYGYVGGRLIDVVVLVFAGLWSSIALGSWGVDLLRRRPRGASILWRRLALRPLFAAFGASLITAGPMIRWAIVRPEDYLSRLNASGLVQTGRLAETTPEAASAWTIAMRQTADAVLAVIGAPADQFYFSPYPMIDVLWGTLLVLGVALALVRWRDLRLLLPTVHLLGAMVLVGLSIHTSTSAYRVGGVLPSIAVLAAVALVAMIHAALKPLGGENRTIGLTTVAVAGPIVAFNLWAYFGVFAPGCRYFDDLTWLASEIGQRVDEGEPEATVFVLGEPDFVPGVFESLPYLSGREVLQVSRLTNDDPQPGAAGDHEVIYSIARGADRSFHLDAVLAAVGAPAPDAARRDTASRDPATQQAMRTDAAPPNDLTSVDATSASANDDPAADPVLVFVAPAHGPDVAAVSSQLPGAEVSEIRRCDRLVAFQLRAARLPSSK